MDVLTVHGQALAAAGEVVAAVRPADGDRPTPCAGWDVRELVDHMVGLNYGFAAGVGGAPADPAAWTGTGPDWAASAERVRAAFAAPGALTGTIDVLGVGPVPAPMAVSFHLLDLVVHGWDLSRALGRPDRPDDGLAATALAVAERLPESPRLRGPGAPFGAKVAVPADAPAYERLLGHLGRSPAWAPVAA
jgi:uncharacterized protein (TIGR03086 family)